MHRIKVLSDFRWHVRIRWLASFAQIAPCLLLISFATSAGAEPVFWNKLGSRAEIENSEIGADGHFEGGRFVDGVFGGAYHARYDEWGQVYFPMEVVPSSRGTIEFWAKLVNPPEFMPSAGGGPRFIYAGQAREVDAEDTSYEIGLCGNDGDGNGGLYATAGNEYTAGTGYFGRYAYSEVLGAGQEENWHHYAMVWDEDGVPGFGADKVVIYLDGERHNGRYHIDVDRDYGFPGILPGNRLLLLVNDGARQGAFAIDNLKIWDYPRSEFSDRFTEGGSAEPIFVRTLGDINGDGSQDIVALFKKDGKLVATVKGAETSGWINTILFHSNLIPVDLEVMPDANGNGAPELVVLGSGSTRSDVHDSLTGENLGTVDFDPNLSPIDLELVTDQIGNGVPELAMLGQGSVKVEVKDPANQSLINTLSFNNNYVPIDLSVWSRGKQVSVGVLGESKDPTRGDKVEIRDLATGQIVQHLWVGKPWNLLQVEMVDDLNGNGAPELAILREHPDDDHVSVLPVDTATGARFRHMGFDPNYRPVRLRVLDDLNGNGSQEVAVLAVRRGCCNQKVWVKDTLTGESIRIVYFGKKFIGEDMAISPDINGNGAPELIVLGRRDDGKIAAIIKDTKTGEFISWVGF